MRMRAAGTGGRRPKPSNEGNRDWGDACRATGSELCQPQTAVQLRRDGTKLVTWELRASRRLQFQQVAALQKWRSRQLWRDDPLDNFEPHGGKPIFETSKSSPYEPKL